MRSLACASRRSCLCGCLATRGNCCLFLVLWRANFHVCGCLCCAFGVCRGDVTAAMSRRTRARLDLPCLKCRNANYDELTLTIVMKRREYCLHVTGQGRHAHHTGPGRTKRLGCSPRHKQSTKHKSHCRWLLTITIVY